MRKSWDYKTEEKRSIDQIKESNLVYVCEKDNTHIFKINNGEKLTMTYLPDGTNVLTGCYGTLTWSRKFGKESDEGFPCSEEGDFGYWISKCNGFVNKSIFEFNQDLACKKLKEFHNSLLEDDINEETKNIICRIQAVMERKQFFSEIDFTLYYFNKIRDIDEEEVYIDITSLDFSKCSRIKSGMVFRFCLIRMMNDIIKERIDL